MPANQTITLETVVTHDKDQISTDLDGELVLLSIEKGNYYNFDKILTKIWGYIKTPMSVSSLCDKLLLEFNIEREVCERDVLEVLKNLYTDKLISIQ